MRGPPIVQVASIDSENMIWRKVDDTKGIERTEEVEWPQGGVQNDPSKSGIMSKRTRQSAWLARKSACGALKGPTNVQFASRDSEKDLEGS